MSDISRNINDGVALDKGPLRSDIVDDQSSDIANIAKLQDVTLKVATV